jgi:hypothetical protein
MMTTAPQVVLTRRTAMVVKMSKNLQAVQAVYNPTVIQYSAGEGGVLMLPLLRLPAPCYNPASGPG